MRPRGWHGYYAKVPLADRFWPKVRKTDGCWEWTACRTRSGYGNIGMGDRVLFAHRVAYELCVGPIPPGLTLDHLCRNRGCVNPAHLEPVTMRENLRRGMSPVGIEARTTHCPRGHAYDQENTEVRRGRRHCRLCRVVRNRAYRLAVRAATERARGTR